MIIELVEYSTAELNSSSGVVKTITNSEITSSSLNRATTPTPHAISVLNESGATIHFVPFSKLEYNAYQSDNSITQMIPLAKDTEKTLNNVKGEITNMMCSGVTGHSSGVTFVFYKD